ncbi:MAG: hypothetical protein M1821_007546 [Bathelium mastoideum]|nr:MAG: hypothetical protein M1821_007546 [Bathelium mastoideum]KAI9695049.1 MAG: hypothetical protein M1822_000666 [Bathelium mastoideum]
MSQLQDALSTLGPVNFDDVPVADLNVFLSDAFAQAEVIANSVPPPPGGDDFLHSKRSTSRVNSAHDASTMTVSSARPAPPTPSHAELQKAWGKPMKINPKENPLGMAMYKMAGHDRHGAWFARSSIHEGLGFDKWRSAMKREFLESLAVEGGPGAGCIRGLGGDRRLEKIPVEGIGMLEVFQLSAQFPGPVAPREFITLLMTSDNCLSDASIPHVDSEKVSKRIPRHFMVISRPCQHPDAPNRDGYVRGQYESIELIREIPLAPSRPSSARSSIQPKSPRKGGSEGPKAGGSQVDLDEQDEAELNPVQWIMVTRSDPGGGIPRFMVERGTPSSIISDASKFLNWACSREFPADAEALDAEAPQAVSQTQAQRAEEGAEELEQVETNGHLSGVEDLGRRASLTMTGQYDERADAKARHQDSSQENGIMSQISNVVDSYTPQFIKDEIQTLTPSTPNPRRSLSSSSSTSTSTSSLQSFADAETFQTAEQGPPPRSSDADSHPRGHHASRSTLSLDSSASHATPTSDRPAPADAADHKGRDAKKLDSQRAALESKLAQQRAGAEKRRARDAEKGEAESAKAQEKHAAAVKKLEERHRKDVEKLEAKHAKAARKESERARKSEEKDAWRRVRRERDGLRERVGYLERENEALRGQVGKLQRENTELVVRIGRMEGGGAILAAVSGEMEGKGEGDGSGSGRARGNSRRSERSERSLEVSGGKGVGGKDGKGQKGEELVGGQA